MTYGPTVGASCISNEIIRRFDKLKRLEKGAYAALRGVCDSAQELEAMLKPLREGKRLFALQSRGRWTGVYFV